MNELLIKRYEKQMSKFGASKGMAKEIVQTAYEIGNGNNMDFYVNYAFDLVYGLGASRRLAIKQG